MLVFGDPMRIGGQSDTPSSLAYMNLIPHSLLLPSSLSFLSRISFPFVSTKHVWQTTISGQWSNGPQWLSISICHQTKPYLASHSDWQLVKHIYVAPPLHHFLPPFLTTLCHYFFGRRKVANKPNFLDLGT